MGFELARNVSNSLRSCNRSASRHPLLLFMLFLLFCTYLWFPLLFTLLLHASPVIASTLLLLGTLLFYGHENAPDVQKERAASHHHEIHNLVFIGMGNTEFDEESYNVHNMNINTGRKFGSSINSHVSRKPPIMVNRGAQLKSRDGSRRNSFDPLHSFLGHIDDDIKGWDSGSNASLADNFPLLVSDENINETDDDDHYDHDDIQVKYGYDDEDETLIRSWTEDDQRNLMNMGPLELERNQRLESLIARQKAIKNMRMLAEKNMANMSPDIRFMNNISTAGNNPFDLPPNHSHENIIGSVPYNIKPRRHSLHLPYDPLGGKPDRMGPSFQFNSVALPTNLPSGRRHRNSDVGIAGHSSQYLYSVPAKIGSDTESIVSTHASDMNEHIIPKSRRLSIDSDTVKLHQAAGDYRSNMVKTGGVTPGYEDKPSNKSSSPSFCDVTDDVKDGDDDNEEEEFGSVGSPTTPDAKALQVLEDSEDSDTDTETETDSDAEEAGLAQRLKSWFTRW